MPLYASFCFNAFYDTHFLQASGQVFRIDAQKSLYPIFSCGMSKGNGANPVSWVTEQCSTGAWTPDEAERGRALKKEAGKCRERFGITYSELSGAPRLNDLRI